MTDFYQKLGKRRCDTALKSTLLTENFVYYSLTMANFLSRNVCLYLVRNSICPSVRPLEWDLANGHCVRCVRSFGRRGRAPPRGEICEPHCDYGAASLSPDLVLKLCWFLIIKVLLPPISPSMLSSYIEPASIMISVQSTPNTILAQAHRALWAARLSPRRDIHYRLNSEAINVSTKWPPRNFTCLVSIVCLIS